MKFYTLIILLTVGVFSLSAQDEDTIMLSPTKDALIRWYAGSGTNVNNGGYTLLNMHTWTNSGENVKHRSLIDFDFSELPENSTLLKANLYLFADPLADYNHYHDPGESNECYIHRAVEDWNEYTVVWDNQPIYTNKNKTLIPASIHTLEDYVVDVTDLVFDSYQDLENSHGFLIRIRYEDDPHRRMSFASRDNNNPELHPKLELIYTETPVGLTKGGKPSDAHVEVFPNPTSEDVYIKSEKIRDASHLRLISVDGKVMNYGINSALIDSDKVKLNLSEISAGIYTYYLLDGKNSIASGKISVVR